MASKEYKKFEDMTNQLLKVPHSEIKAKLEAEKAAKQKKKSAKVKSDDN
jgi:hypothetical protein